MEYQPIIFSASARYFFRASGPNRAAQSSQGRYSARGIRRTLSYTWVSCPAASKRKTEL